jgi:hypothetical protein
MIPQCCSLPTCSLSERLLTPCTRTSSFVASPFPFRFHLVSSPPTAIGTFPVDTLLQQLKAAPLRVRLSPSPSIHTRAHTLFSLTCEVTCPPPTGSTMLVNPLTAIGTFLVNTLQPSRTPLRHPHPLHNLLIVCCSQTAHPTPPPHPAAAPPSGSTLVSNPLTAIGTFLVNTLQQQLKAVREAGGQELAQQLGESPAGRKLLQVRGVRLCVHAYHFVKAGHTRTESISFVTPTFSSFGIVSCSQVALS